MFKIQVLLKYKHIKQFNKLILFHNHTLINHYNNNKLQLQQLDK